MQKKLFLGLLCALLVPLVAFTYAQEDQVELLTGFNAGGMSLGLHFDQQLYRFQPFLTRHSRFGQEEQNEIKPEPTGLGLDLGFLYSFFNGLFTRKNLSSLFTDQSYAFHAGMYGQLTPTHAAALTLHGTQIPTESFNAYGMRFRFTVDLPLYGDYVQKDEEDRGSEKTAEKESENYDSNSARDYYRHQREYEKNQYRAEQKRIARTASLEQLYPSLPSLQLTLGLNYRNNMLSLKTSRITENVLSQSINLEQIILEPELSYTPNPDWVFLLQFQFYVYLTPREAFTQYLDLSSIPGRGAFLPLVWLNYGNPFLFFPNAGVFETANYYVDKKNHFQLEFGQISFGANGQDPWFSLHFSYFREVLPSWSLGGGPFTAISLLSGLNFSALVQLKYLL